MLALNRRMRFKVTIYNCTKVQNFYCAGPNAIARRKSNIQGFLFLPLLHFLCCTTLH